MDLDWSVTNNFNIPLCLNPDPIEFNDGVALDVEDDEHDGFVGIGVFDGNSAYYWSSLDIAKRLVLPKFIAHNGKTDYFKLKKWGFKIDPTWLLDDTIIMSYVSDITKKSHSLKELVKEYLNFTYPKYDDLVGKGKKKVTLDKQPLDLVSAYNACDTVMTYKLYDYFKKTMEANDYEYYRSLEMPIFRILCTMQEQGVLVNTDILTDGRHYFDEESKRLSDKISRYFGAEFNPNSPKQVTEQLFDKLNIQLESTNKEFLSKHSHIPIVADILRLKKVNKLVSTYIQPYIDSGGELHPEFNQVSYSKESKADEGIRTGRLSSKNPNFQNLPSHTKEGMLIRNSIIPQPDNYFVLADYSQIELRVLAHFCKDKRMIETFNKNGDIHQLTAESINSNRTIAKTINFAIVYGSGSWNLHQKTGIDHEEAKQFMARFEKQFPSVYEWKQRSLYYAKKDGYVKTLLGRHVKYELWPNCKKHSKKTINQGQPCRIECKSRITGEAERRAISAIVQGSAAEIIKKSMLRLDEQGYKFPVQEHDALLFEVNKCIDPVTFSQNVSNIMTTLIRLEVPLKVDISVGDSWGACKSK